MLALAIVPCADEADICAVNPTTIELHAGGEEHNHNQHKDECSPFCCCSCCGLSLSTIVVKPASASSPLVCTSADFSFLLRSAQSSPDAIWQPPILS